MPLHLPFRQIHLDFHTGPAIPDVGSKWDADLFGDTLKDARVNSITLFAKCHHGHLYYDTKRAERHPGLTSGLDLLGEQLEACRKRGIRAPIYLSVQCDEYAAMTQPGWRVVDHEGKLFGAPLSPNWHIMDMSSPYADFLEEQIVEVMKKYKPVDAIFLDMCWDQQSCSTWALAGMVKEGLNPADHADREKYALAVSHRYMERYNKLTTDLNRGKPVAVWYNSRPKVRLPQEKKYLQHIEIEALPTGGWGYTYFPINVRFGRVFGLPYLGMTARFHKSWADFGGLKPRAALMYECCQMLAHGAMCSVGDQLHPRGYLDQASYELIGSVYQHVEACEPWCQDATPVTQIAVLRSLTSGYHVPAGGEEEGAVRALQQLGQQFDFQPAIPEADLSTYELVIVPAGVKLDAGLVKLLRSFVKAGGKLIVEAAAALGEDGQSVMGELGVKFAGQSPFVTTYLRFDKSVGEPGGNVPSTDHVLYERTIRMTAEGKATVLAKIVEPYFDRAWNHFSSHFQTPADKVSKFAAAVINGNIVTLAAPMLKAYATHGNLSYRHLIKAALDRLLPEPLTRVCGPSHLEVSLTRQAKPARTMAHVVSFVPSRRAVNMDIVEEPTAVTNMGLSIKADKAPKSVTLQPSGESIAFEYAQGYVTVKLTFDSGHAMVVVE
jgi:hypothetical protein